MTKTAMIALAATAALGASVLATAPALAQNNRAAPARVETFHDGGMSGPEVVAWLQKAGYKAELSKDDGGDPLIDSAAEGTKFKIYFYDCDKAQARCKALQFSAGFDLKTGLKAEKMNEWNKGHRYLKAYIDEEGDPYIQYDVNVNAGRTLAGLDDDFGVWTSMISEFTTFIDW